MSGRLPRKFIRTLFYHGLQQATLRRILLALPIFRRLHSGAHLTHPVDRAYGIDTSSFFPEDLIAPKARVGGAINSYVGSSPDLLRQLLSGWSDLAGCSFVDLGCGKGRALVVASEFPFRQIIGVELSAKLCRIARKNLKVVQAAYPERQPIVLVEDDALNLRWPDGDLVVYFYNSFRAQLVGQLVGLIERWLSLPGRRLRFIYVNPEWAALFDASPALTRLAVPMQPAPPEHAGYGLSRHDLQLVVWQGGAG
jgi:SAM-dependent methyltransferase